VNKPRRTVQIGIATIVAGTGILALAGATAADDHFADAGNRALVMLGRQLYAGHCAGCHGRNLQGQPLWQLRDYYAGRRAPALDETGYIWQHSDEAIFEITSHSRSAGQPRAMPAFKGVLNDSQILAIIAFIKARWPIALRILQAMRNPGFKGMPAAVNDADWQLPANCRAVLRGSSAKTIPSK
jgi:mono/diheme cytochrome c family protein